MYNSAFAAKGAATRATAFMSDWTGLIPSVRGMRDLLPAETGDWRRVESIAAACFSRYGYGEIRTPIVERRALFARQLGEDADIVQKEMYVFPERSSGDELCLRPEATVPTVRAVAAASMYRGGLARVWYGGPMFRHERPQKGRYRQFWQLGAEAIGSGAPDPAVDAEQIIMLADLWKSLNIGDKMKLSINNLGTAEERGKYRAELSDYFRNHIKDLDETAQARIDGNPMRILDSKDEKTAAIAARAPKIESVLGEESRRHVETVKSLLKAADVVFEETHSLVRGLDYYNLTVFEWSEKGDERRQNAVCGGGRYDGLSTQIGGPPLHGCGFALGLDRLVALSGVGDETPPDCFLAVAGASDTYCARAAAILRAGGLSVWQHSGGGNIARQFKKADAMKTPLAVIAGEKEESKQILTIKRLRDGVQRETAIDNAAAAAAELYGEQL